MHLVGIVGAVAGVGALLGLALMRRDFVSLVPLSVYGFGLLAMLGCSAAYNLARTERWRDVLRRFDHAAIFAMIAGTYTPFTVLALEGAWAYGLTALIWSLAFAGIVLRVRYQHRFEPLFLALYVALGWIGIVALGPLLSSAGLWTVGLLVAGGLIYSAGIIFHVWEQLPFQRAVWHGFVVVAAGVHYAAVLSLVVV